MQGLTRSSTHCLAHGCRHIAVILLVLVAVAGFGGCQGSGPSNSLSGSVTLEGKPVTGNLTLVGSNGKTIEAGIGPDGTYHVPDPPLGMAKIAIKPVPGGAVFVEGPKNKDTEKFATDLKGKDKAIQMPVSPPAKYGSVETSNLTVEVKAGKQKQDFPLTP